MSVSGMMIRRTTAVLTLAFAVLFAAAPWTGAAPVEIERVWTDYRLGKDYIRLGEILSGRRFTGGSTEHRTQAESGDGYFFTVRVDRASAWRKQDYTLRLSIIPPDASATRVFTFPIPASKKRGLRLELGVTGSDWPYGELQPLAWRVEVLDSTGTLVADEKSYLWEKPPAKQS